MKKPVAAVRPARASMLDMLFAGGSTVVFLTIMASVAGAISQYLR
jgi:hypothetical protein